ncbi:upstream stimulatory factor 1-like [Stylophora pistillata]|uniref:upstream stimulatory factor 1-like n=1 Tax=Stylophora pistillata TaxID=50429 RepID=UPI000C04E8B8|nr:upstream stimulatory factor 1-like [Stylophora pistillata]
MTSLFDPMTTTPHSSSPTLDMLDGSLDPEKNSPLQDPKSTDPTQVPEPETVTVTVSTVSEEQTAAALVGQQANAAFGDPGTLQFQYRTDATGVQTAGFNGGSQPIRVVQVQATDPTGERVDAATAAFAPQVQTVIQSPFSNGSSPTHTVEAEGAADGARFTYFQAADGATTATVVQAGTNDSLDGTSAYTVRNIPVSLTQPSSPSQIPITMAEAQTITTVGTAAGGFYVMMSPQDVMPSGNQRNIAPAMPHKISTKLDAPRTARDEKRRATHNEVERRRRDKINSWINKLAKVVPECCTEQTKAGQVGGAQNISKGGILSKTVDYINELKLHNTRMAENIKDTERLTIDTELLRQQVEDLRQENALLRAQLQQHGIELATTGQTV